MVDMTSCENALYILSKTGQCSNGREVLTYLVIFHVSRAVFF